MCQNFSAPCGIYVKIALNNNNDVKHYYYNALFTLLTENIQRVENGLYKRKK